MRPQSKFNKSSLRALLSGVFTCILFFSTPSTARSDPYYTVTPIFLPCPSSTGNKPWNVPDFGPVGIGITLKPMKPGFEMVISDVDQGSPAAATDKLKKGQVIESINGQVLKDLDPRIILGDLITEAEATDGRIMLSIKGVGDVLVQIPVMGSYSATWPVNCPKSDKIVRNLADLLAKQESPRWGSVLFMLSTGEEKDLDVVRKWMSKLDSLSTHQWNIGYHGIGVCEYYLRTGDQRVLPIIAEAAESLRATMYNGGWSARGNPAQFTYSTGSGQLHAAGVHCMTFLVLARMCGVEVDDYTFSRSFKQFYRFAGRGNVAYGDTWPEGGFRDNGKTSGLAVTMAYAARLTPDGESSVYAKARDNSAMKAFYATNWFHAAHTGGGMGEVWHHAAISLIREKRPVAYRSYLDTRRWLMDLSRRPDGSIGIAGMEDRYDKSATEDNLSFGTLFALTYTYPRKTLQLTGAPKTQWCKTFTLPERPWGTPADDVFNSPEPAKHPSISMDDLMNEKVVTDASIGVFGKLGSPDVSDQLLLKYIHHPEYDLRSYAMDKVVEFNRDHLVMPLLQSDDARLRHAGVLALAGMFKGKPLPPERITPEMWERVSQMIEDPNESWWVTIDAMKALARANPQKIAQHIDRLLVLLESENWWVSAAAGEPLAVIAMDPLYHQRVLPPLLKTIAGSETVAGVNAFYGLTKQLSAAKPDVKQFAASHLKAIYADIPSQSKEPSNNLPLPGKSAYVRKTTAWILQQTPGGDSFAETLPKMTLQARRTGQESDMYAYNGKFTPNKAVMGRWVRVGLDDPKELESWVTKWKKQGSKPHESAYSFQLLNGGRIKGEGFLNKMGQEFFWTGDLMIGKFSANEARRMELRTIDGVDFLLIEKGGFGSIEDVAENPVAADWHCGYQIHVRGDDRKAGP